MINKLQNLNPGESIVYWTGNCIAGSTDHIQIRNMAWTLYLQDLVDLTQRVISRTGNGLGNYDYIARRRVSPPNPKVVIHRNNMHDALNGI